MKLNSIRINTLSAEAFIWYCQYLKAVDEKDIHAYGLMLAEDCEMYLNNAGPIVGKGAILGMLSQYWPAFGTLEHEPLNLYGDDRHFVLEALNHYTRLDGTAITLRAVAFTDRDESGLVKSARVFSDTAPLFASGN